MRPLRLALLLFFLFQYYGAAQTDSLADVFPLAVGNQWAYRYFANTIDALSEVSRFDTGNVVLRIVQQVVDTDSIRWRVEQRRNLIRRASSMWDTLVIVTPITDTTIFELVELLSGQHQLYRTGNWIQYLPDLFPYSKQHSDTTSIFRYRKVDGTGKATFRSKPHWMVNSTFTFRRGVGMERYQSTGYPLTGTLLTVDHQLRSSIILNVDDGTNLLSPRDFALYQNYPNPFNPTTRIKYSLQKSSHVSLKVFDVLGREVASLVDGVQDADVKGIEFDAGKLSSGVYFYRLQAGGFVETKKMVLMR